MFLDSGTSVTSVVKPRPSSQVARWSITRRLLWSSSGAVQLTEGSLMSVRNISSTLGSDPRDGLCGGMADFSERNFEILPRFVTRV